VEEVMRTLIRLALSGIVIGAGVGVRAQGPAPVSRTTYLVVYRPGPGWLAGKPLSEQPLGEHGKYVGSLHAKGLLKLGGPFLDDSGGALVLEVENEAEAKAVVARDPAVVARVFVGELHPWRLVDWEHSVRK